MKDKSDGKAQAKDQIQSPKREPGAIVPCLMMSNSGSLAPRGDLETVRI
jgi:hypothetical protein